jgi:hypothetical protein
MKMRKITSLTAAISFLLMLLTSVILYIVPQGRVAYWADWRLWGLSKTEWGNLHINLGLLFLIALGLHTYYNWKPLMNYLKDKAKKMKVFTAEFNAALIITVVFTLGTYFLVPPFNWVMGLNDYFKDAGAEKYGEPPYGHAELSSLRTFTKKTGIDIEKAMGLLEKAGLAVDDEEMTLAAIGEKYGVPPQKVYDMIRSASIKPEQAGGGAAALPESPPPGTGNLTLADFCVQYGLNVKSVERELKKAGVSAAAELTLKKIAANNETSPIDIYERIRELTR